MTGNALWISNKIASNYLVNLGVNMRMRFLLTIRFHRKKII